MIKVELENGEKEVLCTSLTDAKTYLYEEFEQLYHYRWNEEEAYKLLKTASSWKIFRVKLPKQLNKVYPLNYKVLQTPSLPLFLEVNFYVFQKGRKTKKNV